MHNSMDKIPILAVLCQDPFAWRDGGTYCVRAGLRKLAEKGDVTVVGFGEDFNASHVGPYRSAGSLGEVINSKAAFVSTILRGSSYSVRKYSSASAQRHLAEVVRGGEYSIIWCDKLLASCVIVAVRDSSSNAFRPKIIVRSHNIEHRLIAERFDRNSFPSRMLVNLEAMLLKRYEVALPSFVDQIFTISKEDCDSYRALRPDAQSRIEFLPIAVEIPEQNSPLGLLERRAALFIGDCEWRPNLQAARWIADELAPLLAARIPELQLRIIGRGTEIFRGVSSNIEALGFVDSLEEEYASALCSIAPVRIGSGVNIKVIESLAQGVPVVGTPFARRGIATTAYLTAESPSEFTGAIEELRRDAAKYSELVAGAKRDMAESDVKFDNVWSSFRNRTGI